MIRKDNFKDLEKNLLPHLPKNKDSKILDFGCGSGRVIQFLLDNDYHNLVAADIDQDSLISIQENHKIETILINDTRDFLNSINNTYDLIIAKDVIYYFKDDEIIDFINLMNESLKENGVAIIEIFNGSTLTGPFVQYKDLGIKLILTEHSLAQCLKLAKFDEFTIHPNKIHISGIKTVFFLLSHTIWQYIYKFLYFLERGLDSQNPKFLSRKLIAVAKK